MTDTAVSALLCKVNAPYQTYMDASTLAGKLKQHNDAGNYAGQVSSFFTEIPFADQLAFAGDYGISTDEISASAKHFSEVTGAYSPLAFHMAA